MNIIDIIILLCFIPAIISGLRKGFIAQITSIIAIVLGVWLSYELSCPVTQWLKGFCSASEQTLSIVSFAIIFIASAVLLHLAGRLIEKLLQFIMLGWLNRMLGLALSLFKCLLILGLAAYFFDSINAGGRLVSRQIFDDSLLYGYIQDSNKAIFPYIQNLVDTI